MDIIYFIIIFWVGLSLGSFFNVLIWRLPRGESVVFPPSHCPNCDHRIRPWENIPVVSFLLLKGKCSSCKNRISWIYPATELTTAAMALLFWYLLWERDQTIWGYLLFGFEWVSLLLIIPIAIIDLRHYIIPDIFTIPFLFLALAISFIPGAVSPLYSAIGMLAGGGSLLVIGWLGKILFKKGEAMGGGDIKLMAFIGALWGPQIALLSIVFGAFSGSLAGLGLMAARRLDDEHKIPFGPFLGLGVWIAVFAGDTILNAYMDWVGTILF